MSNDEQVWAQKVLAGDRRAIAKAISLVEDRDPSGIPLLKQLFPKSGSAYVIGVTGSPGAGKSTLVEKLAAEYRAQGQKVGIVAVDPTSPFSGGAILGDRIRMQSLFGDEGVYIRSMATRGHLGGLAPAARDVVTVLDAAGCGVVLVETVGVGQDEVEIARHADVTALLLVPGMGDDVQTFKAGVMEIGDIFVVNKADRSGAERVEQEVLAMLAISSRADGWRPPVIRTIASTGTGISNLRQVLEEFRSYANQHALSRDRQRQQWRVRLTELLRERLYENAMARLPQDVLDEGVEALMTHRRDPHSIVNEMISDYSLKE